MAPGQMNIIVTWIQPSWATNWGTNYATGQDVVAWARPPIQRATVPPKPPRFVRPRPRRITAARLPPPVSVEAASLPLPEPPQVFLARRRPSVVLRRSHERRALRSRPGAKTAC